MTFKEAEEFVMPIGKYKGMTIKTVAIVDKGLLYLDWMLGEKWVNEYAYLQEAIHSYLADPLIAKDLRNLLEQDEE